MNKKMVIVAIVLLLLLLGGWYLMKSKKAVSSVTSVTSGTPNEQKSLKDLLSSGIAQKCTYSGGTTYISSGKVRGDFSTTISDKTTASHMISDGKTSYIWTDGEKNGFKMTLGESPTPGTTSQTPGNSAASGTDLNQKADYKCSNWTVDESYFTPPGTVTFTDLSQMTNPSGAPTSGTGGTSSQCSYCNTLSGDDKTQCLTALKCN